MNDINTSPNGTPVRRKLKKVKKPIKRPISSPEMLSVPQKSTEAAFSTVQNQDIIPSIPDFNAEPIDDQQKNMDAFNLDAFLDNDNLPTIQQDTRLQQNNFERSFISDEDINPTPQTWREKLMVGDLYTGFAVFVTAAVFLLFGIMFAKIFLSGPTTVQNGLQGVVINSEVPRGRARCGVAEKTQGCVLYIMNPQRQDLNGRDFYDLAAQLTGRQRFMIETGNMRYSSIKIKPGEIAQLNIPPLQ